MPATATPKRSVTSRAKQASKAKAAANESAGNGAASSRRSHEATLKLAQDIKAARDAGTSWADIKAQLGVDPAQGQYLIKVAAVKPKDRITYSDDPDLAKQAKALRKEGLSKAEIAARAGVSVPKIKRLLDETPGQRVTTAKPKAAKPAAKKEAAAEGEQPKRRRRRRAEADPTNA